MKDLTIGVFRSREDAERAINHLHSDVDIGHEHISYIYRSTDGTVKEVKSKDVADRTPAEGAKTGAIIGGTAGALAGIAGVLSAIPVVGPIVAAGPIAAALGLSGAVGATVGGAAVGAAGGGLIGALVTMGISDEYARDYADRVHAGDILVAVHSDQTSEVAAVMEEAGAERINAYAVTV